MCLTLSISYLTDTHSSETIDIAGAVQSLTTVIQKALSDIIAAKTKFDKLLIVSPTVLANLKEEKKATDAFGSAITDKVPAALQEIAKSLLQPIDDAFTKAISAYGGSGWGW